MLIIVAFPLEDHVQESAIPPSSEIVKVSLEHTGLELLTETLQPYLHKIKNCLYISCHYL